MDLFLYGYAFIFLFAVCVQDGCKAVPNLSLGMLY